MTIKHFCDVCDRQINRNYVSDRLVVQRGPFVAEVMVSKDGTSNTGELCKDCVMEMFTYGEEPPRGK